MPNLEQSIAEWRKTMRSVSQLASETLTELENHLRETVEQLVGSGMPEAQAFDRAVAQLGPPETVASEFGKLNPLTWRPAAAVTGIGLLAALLFAWFDFSWGNRNEILVAAHVFSVTVGYGATLLLGVLGLCFVCQRSAGDFSGSRLQALSRISSIYARIALVFTALGLILGMVWSHTHWGSYWGWSSRELGGLAVVLWLICYLLADRWQRMSARGLLLSSLLGSNLVILAWFGPNVSPTGLHSYGLPGGMITFLIAAFAANLAFFLIGLAPAGWLRLRRA